MANQLRSLINIILFIFIALISKATQTLNKYRVNTHKFEVFMLLARARKLDFVLKTSVRFFDFRKISAIRSNRHSSAQVDREERKKRRRQIMDAINASRVEHTQVLCAIKEIKQ